MKRSIPEVAINNECFRTSYPKGMNVEFPSDKGEWANKHSFRHSFVQNSSDFGEFTNQKCVPSTNPNIIL